MPHSRNPNNYLDVKAVFDAVLASEEQCGTLEFETHGKAISWRQRAYAYRALLQRLQRERGESIETRYDPLVLTTEGTTTTIKWRQVTGQLKIGGKVVELSTKLEALRAEGEAPKPSPISADDPLLLAALKITGQHHD